MQQTNDPTDPIAVGRSTFLFDYTSEGRTSDSLTAPALKTYLYMRGLGPDVVSVVVPIGVYLLDFFYSLIARRRVGPWTL